MAITTNVRLISHGASRGPSSISGGKAPPTNVSGSLVDIPSNSADIHIYTANGWSKLGYVGSTAQRPTNLNAGDPYVDTTLNKIVIYDGVAFRDPISGSVV